MELIQIDGVFKSFGLPSEQREVVALDDVSAQIRKGEFFSIIGPSGCGKTTLLHMIAGFTSASKGAVYYKGKPILRPDATRTVVFQEYGLFPWMTVRENIEFGLKAKKIDARQRADLAQRYLQIADLDGFGDRYPREISGGMKQRVGIARALAPDPDVVLMDEPFGALDSLPRDLMQEEILNIWSQTKDKTFVLITHNIDEAIFLSDRVLVMTARPGRVKAIVPIDLPRPRHPDLRTRDDRFRQYRDQLSHLLRSEAQAVDGAEKKRHQN